MDSSVFRSCAFDSIDLHNSQWLRNKIYGGIFRRVRNYSVQEKGWNGHLDNLGGWGTWQENAFDSTLITGLAMDSNQNSTDWIRSSFKNCHFDRNDFHNISFTYGDTYEKCLFTGNKHFGLQKVVDCQFRDNEYTGMASAIRSTFYQPNGAAIGTAEDCELVGNRDYGFSIDQARNLKIRNASVSLTNAENVDLDAGGVNQGGLDFFPSKSDTTKTSISHVTFRNYTGFSFWFNGGVRLEDCLFENMEIDNLYMWSPHLKNCTFRNILIKKMLIYGYKATFEGCKFENVRLASGAYTTHKGDREGNHTPDSIPYFPWEHVETDSGNLGNKAR